MWCCCNSKQEVRTDNIVTYDDENVEADPCAVKAEAVIASARGRNEVDLDAVTSQTPQRWSVTLQKGADKGPLGLELDVDAEKGLAVLREPRLGPAREWNKLAGHKGFRPGDIVVAVNGEEKDANELLQMLKELESFTLSMKRLVNYTINLEVTDGLGIQLADRGGRTVVDKIENSGDVFIYNAACLAGYRVARGDWLLALNGISGEPLELMQRAGTLPPGMVALQFGRPSPLETTSAKVDFPGDDAGHLR